MQSTRDLPNLDLMRSFAVILVVASHLLLYTHSDLVSKLWFIGQLGVYLFFVHTTLVLMWSLDRDPHTLRFYVRRTFRIYPLWLVVLALSVAIGLPTSPVFAPDFGYQHASWRALVENATLTFNLIGNQTLIGASWTLPVEVQMYVLLPFLYFFMRSQRQLWPLLLLWLLAAATARMDVAPISATLVFCAPTFLPGAIAYLRYQNQKPVLPAWLFPILLFTLTAACNRYASIKQVTWRSGWLFALIVGLSLPLFRQITWPPLCRVVHLVARYSYGIYLMHFPAIAVSLYYLRGQNVSVKVAAFVGTLAVLSAAAYHFVEKPMITLGSRLAKRLQNGPEPPANERMFSLEPAP